MYNLDIRDIVMATLGFSIASLILLLVVFGGIDIYYQVKAKNECIDRGIALIHCNEDTLKDK